MESAAAKPEEAALAVPFPPAGDRNSEDMEGVGVAEPDGVGEGEGTTSEKVKGDIREELKR